MWQKVLVLAPHLNFPARDGADLVVDRLWSNVSRLTGEVHILGCCEHRVFVSGAVKSSSSFPNSARSKANAAARTIFFSSHYTLEKFVTGAFISKATQLLAEQKFDLLVCSYFSTADRFLKHAGDTTMLVYTHNDDFKLFQNMKSHSSNVVQTIVAKNSIRWTTRRAQRAKEIVFLHVSQADAAGWTDNIGAHRNIIVPVGCEVRDRPQRRNLRMTDEVQLLFVGSLGVKMNYDALEFFVQRFWPELVKATSGSVRMTVLGSNPSEKVVALCASQGFRLIPNASEDELIGSYQAADFAVLPFPYSTGSKLKLVESLSFGVPYLATSKVFDPAFLNLPGCVVSDDPADWVRQIVESRERELSANSRIQLVEAAQKLSWPKIAEDLWASLREVAWDI